MGKTNIQWCDYVWNVVTGCNKISQGCKNCYAETYANRFWGERKFTDVQYHENKLQDPFKWKKPQRIFVNSMSDLFHEDVPSEFIADVFNTMACATRECQHNNIEHCSEECWTGTPHTFLILTKRPERMIKFVNEEIYEITEHWPGDCPINIMMGDNWPLPNVWLGVSCEDQKTADERIPLLLQTPAAVRFISAGPLLGQIDLKHYFIGDIKYWGIDELFIPRLNWVIVGGESGKSARPMHPDWARNLRDQCKEAHVPFFFKQWGEWYALDREIPKELWKKNKIIEMSEELMQKVGKKQAGRLLDGIEYKEFPEGMR